MKILCLNDYPIPDFSGGPLAVPRHLFYGIDSLHRAGFEVVVASPAQHPWLEALRRVNNRMKCPVRLGDLSQQYNAYHSLEGIDAIYAMSEFQMYALASLRAVGLMKVPIVCLAHHPFERGRFRFVRRPSLRLAVRGVDVFGCLSSVVAEEINRMARSPRKATVLPWGPDLDFYPATPAGRGVVASGRTERDFGTLAAAATAVDYPVSVLTTPDCWEKVPEEVRHGVEATICDDPSAFSWEALMGRYAAAAAIAVPMKGQETLCGLTSIADALGMGRAVIVTRNRPIDIDVEREGVGLWVEPGDVDGWVRAIRFVRDNPDEIRRMGERARLLAETRYNSRTFGDRLVELVRNAVPTGH